MKIKDFLEMNAIIYTNSESTSQNNQDVLSPDNMMDILNIISTLIDVNNISDITYKQDEDGNIYYDEIYLLKTTSSTRIIKIISTGDTTINDITINYKYYDVNNGNEINDILLWYGQTDSILLSLQRFNGINTEYIDLMSINPYKSNKSNTIIEYIEKYQSLSDNLEVFNDSSIQFTTIANYKLALEIYNVEQLNINTIKNAYDTAIDNWIANIKELVLSPLITITKYLLEYINTLNNMNQLLNIYQIYRIIILLQMQYQIVFKIGFSRVMEILLEL